MNTLIPCLWFDTEAQEAAEWYVSLFPNSTLGDITRYTEAGQEFHKQEAGSVMTASCTLSGMPFLTLNGGPVFTFNPSVSFYVECETKDELNHYWRHMSERGKPLMELGSYPFSEWYGWIQDMFGVSWQFIYAPANKGKQKITPTLMFTGLQAGKAEEALHLYTSLFKNSRIDILSRYEQGEEPNTAGTIKFSRCFLDGQQLGAMDSSYDHGFSFNEAVSFIIECDTQEEIDHFWEGLLSEGGQEQQCGWLKDRYGVSWQVTPKQMTEFLTTHDHDTVMHSMNALMKMKKIIMADLFP